MSKQLVIELSNQQVAMIRDELRHRNLDNCEVVHIGLADSDKEFLAECISKNTKFESGIYSLEFLAMKSQLEQLDKILGDFKRMTQSTFQELYAILHPKVEQK